MSGHDAEVAIVGGGAAGLSAALTLGRSRRRTVLFDAGAPRNAPSPAAHNVFTRDGSPPAELLRIAREQLGPYKAVEIRERHVADARRLGDGGFELIDDRGGRLTAGQLILATGVVDELPEIPGLRALWGTGVFHCPYCHGWEVRGEAFVLIAQGEKAFHFAQLLRGWAGSLVVCPVHAGVLNAEQRETLIGLGIEVTDEPVVELVPGEGGRVVDVVLAGGRRLGPAAVFVSAPVRQRSPLPERLGCTIIGEGMLAGLVQVDERCFSGVPGVYVVGDAARGPGQVIKAAYEGATAGAAINNELLLAGRLPAGATGGGAGR